MSTRLFDDDAFTGTTSLFHAETNDEAVHLEHRADVEPVVDFCKANFNARDGRWRDGMNHVASIPNVIYEDLVRRGIAQDKEAFRRWLNERDNQVFRTRPGKV